jgi:hypothetical protein
MKPLALLLCASLLLSGCATSGIKRIERRKQERSAAYSALTPDQKAAVDAGQIKVGMNMDAVYIAWGKPNQILSSESAQGTLVTWIYQGTYLQGYTYWGYGPYLYPGYRYDPGPRLAHDYYPVPFVRAEVVFSGGIVQQWRTLPAPGY